MPRNCGGMGWGGRSFGRIIGCGVARSLIAREAQWLGRALAASRSDHPELLQGGTGGRRVGARRQALDPPDRAGELLLGFDPGLEDLGKIAGQAQQRDFGRGVLVLVDAELQVEGGFGRHSILEHMPAQAGYLERW